MVLATLESASKDCATPFSQDLDSGSSLCEAKRKYLLTQLGSSTLSPLAYAKRFQLGELGEPNARADFVNALQLVARGGFTNYRGRTRSIVEAAYAQARAHAFTEDLHWHSFFAKQDNRARLGNQVDRRHVAIGELRTREDEGKVGEAPLEGPARSASKRRHSVLLREEAEPDEEDILLLARGSPRVTRYIQLAINHTNHQDLRRQQQGRHTIRLLRDAMTMDYKILEAIEGSSEQQRLNPKEYLYDLNFFKSAFEDSPKIMQTIKDLIKDGTIKGVKPTWWRVWRKNEMDQRSMLDKVAAVALIRLASQVDILQPPNDEQDVRSVWAEATRLALPLPAETGVAMSLEFNHEYQGVEDEKDFSVKSDITITIQGEDRRFGSAVVEVQKLSVHGCVHKDHIKAPAELAQQIVSLLCAANIREDELEKVEFWCGLISGWTAKVFQTKLRMIDDMLWIIRWQQGEFRLGPDNEGVAGILAYGEFVRNIIFPASAFLSSILERGDLPHEMIMSRIAALPTAPPSSRASKGQITPKSKKPRRNSQSQQSL